MSFFGTDDYFNNVALGLISGRAFAIVLGRNQNMQISVGTQTLWDGGGNYEYLSADTALFISSSSASDTAVNVTITGLDDTYTEIVRTVVVGGQTQVAITGDMFRVLVALVTGSVTPIGTLYVAEADTLTAGVPDTATKIKAIIPLGITADAGTIYASDNISHNSLFTVPANKTCLIHRIAGETGKDENAVMSGRVRFFGGPFLNRNELFVYQSRFDEVFVPPLVLPAKTDLEFRGIPGANGSTASISAKLELVDD